MSERIDRTWTAAVALLTAALLLMSPPSPAAERGWRMHVIDNSSRGADGVRLADVNGDGRADIVTGWEQGGVIRVYSHPGPERVKQAWPVVSVGRVGSPEDATFVDLDRDGRLDVVSSCEGRTRMMFVHWAPDASAWFQSDAWLTEAIPVTEGRSWMFCLPLHSSREQPVELIVGAKGSGATISRLVSGPQPRDLAGWRLETLYNAGWIMSLVAVDMDGDGDRDVVFSDRKGPARGCKWLENPQGDPRRSGDWPVHVIGGTDREVMFLDVPDPEANARERPAPAEVAVATRDGGVLVFRRGGGEEWTTHEIAMPPGTGTGKAVRVADIDGDGRRDLVVSCENAAGRSGVFWLSSPQAGTGPRPEKTTGPRPEKATDPRPEKATGPRPEKATATHLQKTTWSKHEISGRERGVKYDLVELLDLDADGDLDVLTCEERDNLGVIWYENPIR